jgi:hypothetical protein
MTLSLRANNRVGWFLQLLVVEKLIPFFAIVTDNGFQSARYSATSEDVVVPRAPYRDLALPMHRDELMIPRASYPHLPADGHQVIRDDVPHSVAASKSAHPSFN